MSAVNDAKGWAKELVRRESRGPGDNFNAMKRVARRHEMSWRIFWTLRYRPPRDLMTGIYEKLRCAYLAECERQERLLRHEIEITKAKGIVASPGLRAAATLVGEDDA